MAMHSIIDSYAGAGSALHDSIKALRANICFSRMDERIRTIVITSVLPNEGKTTLAAFLGIAYAEGGQRTLLVDCDCRKPMLRNYLKMHPENCLIDVLSQRVSLERAITNTGVEGLDLLSTLVLANPVEALGSNRFQSMVEELKDMYDIILFDTPPLGSFIEAAILASKADGTILALQPGSTDVSAAQAVVAQLKKAQAEILGVVLNGVSVTNDYYSNYYYSGKKTGKSERIKNLVRKR